MTKPVRPFFRRPQRAFPAVALAVTCAAGAVAISGCGSSSVSDPVAKAATTSNSVPGFRANITMEMDSAAIPSGITATGTGTFDVRDHAGSMNLAMQLPNSPQITQALGSSTLNLEERIRQLTIYMKMPSTLSSKLPGGKPWWKLNLAKAAAAQGLGGLSSLTSNPAGGDPSQFLQYMRGAGKVTKLGSAQIAGFNTTHYHVLVDLDKVPNKLPSADRPAVNQTIKKLESMLGSHQLPVDVWIDSNNLIRRMQMRMSLAPASGQALTMSMQITIPQYGAQPEPPVPPASQVTDLTALAGAAAGAGSSSSGSGSSNGSLGTATQPGY